MKIKPDNNRGPSIQLDIKTKTQLVQKMKTEITAATMVEFVKNLTVKNGKNFVAKLVNLLEKSFHEQIVLK